MEAVNPQNQKSHQPSGKRKIKKTAATRTITKLLRISKKGGNTYLFIYILIK